MESNIVKDFENLSVFAHHNFIRMDELVQDLTTALEETAHVGRPGTSQAEGANSNTYPRRYVKKRRGIRRSSANSYYWKRGTISEASESSVDEYPIIDYAGNVIHSDSDDLAACLRISKRTVPLIDSVPLVESDSFTENLSPLRPQRRRRKFKTMAVDSSPLTDHIVSDADSASGDRQLGKRKEESPVAMTERPIYSAPRNSLAGANSLPQSYTFTAGKRKRSSKSRTDYHSCHHNEIVSHHKGAPFHMDRMEVASISQESSLSSSEFDSDVNGNNEDTREADDEQSDFFHEPGPACGIPDIVPWWENERVTDEPLRIDSDFEKILTGTFAHLPKFTNQSFKARMGRLMSGSGREIRLGRRKLKGKMPRYTVGRFLQDREHWNRMQSHHHQGAILPCSSSSYCINNNNNNSSSLGGEFKRRKNVSRTVSVVEGMSSPCLDTVSESTMNQKIMRSNGVGVIKSSPSPVIAVRRISRKSITDYINVSDS